MDANSEHLPFWKTAIYAGVFGVAYLAAAELGHALSFSGDFATFWPPSGLFVGGLLIADRRRWPVLCAATLCANLISDVQFHGKAVPVSFGFWVANATEAFAGAALVRRFSGPQFILDRLRNVLWIYTVPALLTPMLGAVIGAVVVAVAFDAEFWSSWLTWWISDVVGIVAFAPLIVSVHAELWDRIRIVRPMRIVELLLLLAGLALNVEFVFGHQSTPLVWTTMPFMLWAALRFEVTGVSLAIVVTTVLMAKNTAQGRGPFAAGWSPVEQMLLARAFILVSGVSFVTVAVALRERRVAVARIVEDEVTLRDLYENMNEHVYSTGPDGRFLRVNRACCTALGYTEAEFLSMTVAQVVHPDELPRLHSDLERQLAGEKLAVHSRVVTKAGAILYVEGTTEFIFKHGQPAGSRSIFRDVTARKEHEAQLDRYRRRLEEANARWELLATTDGLTRLKNRRAFQAKLIEEVERARRYETPLSLLLLDIDYFKRFNDTFGHPAGDGVLRGVGQLLQETARTTDFVARYGGEEFAIILLNTDEENAITVADRFRVAVEQGDWRERAITVSIGVATLQSGDRECSKLINAADAALYQSKEHGRNCVYHASQCGELPVVSDPQSRMRDSRWSLPSPLLIGLSASDLAKPGEL
ncbi:MAG: diguanylate cyclase [Planctomycetaceae bacterium]|nr:diguanylate cyclase [Planctomycetaceae bacterium]